MTVRGASGVLLGGNIAFDRSSAKLALRPNRLGSLYAGGLDNSLRP